MPIGSYLSIAKWAGIAGLVGFLLYYVHTAGKNGERVESLETELQEARLANVRESEARQRAQEAAATKQREAESYRRENEKLRASLGAVPMDTPFGHCMRVPLDSGVADRLRESGKDLFLPDSD